MEGGGGGVREGGAVQAEEDMWLDVPSGPSGSQGETEAGPAFMGLAAVLLEGR